MSGDVLISVEVAIVTCTYTVCALLCILCVLFWCCHRCKRVFNSKVNIRMDILSIITLVALSIVPISLWLYLVEYFIDWSNHSNIGLIDVIHFYDSQSISIQFYITVIAYPFSKYLTWILLFFKWHDSFAYTPLQSSKKQYNMLLLLLSLNIVPLLLGIYHLCFLNINNIIGYAAGILWFVLDLIYSIILGYFFISKLLFVANLDTPKINTNNKSRFFKSKSTDDITDSNYPPKGGLPKAKSVGFVVNVPTKVDHSHNMHNNLSRKFNINKGKNEKKQFQHVRQVSQPVDKLEERKANARGQSPQLAQIPQMCPLSQDSLTPQTKFVTAATTMTTTTTPIPGLVAAINSNSNTSHISHISHISHHKSQESATPDINLIDLSRLTQSHDHEDDNHDDNDHHGIHPAIHERVASSSIQSHIRQDSSNGILMDHGFHIELQTQFCLLFIFCVCCCCFSLFALFFFGV